MDGAAREELVQHMSEGAVKLAQGVAYRGNRPGGRALSFITYVLVEGDSAEHRNDISNTDDCCNKVQNGRES